MRRVRVFVRIGLVSELQGTPWDHVLVMYPVEREGGTIATSAVEHRIAAFEDAHRDILSGDAEHSRAWTFPILANDLERRYLRWLGEVPDFGVSGRRVRRLGTLVRQALWASLGVLGLGLIVRLSMGSSLGELVMFLGVVGVVLSLTALRFLRDKMPRESVVLATLAGDCPHCGHGLAGLPDGLPGKVLRGLRTGPRRCPECGAWWPLVPPGDFPEML